MANPVLINCPVDTWTVVASGVTAGAIYNMTPSVKFLQTYRTAGQAAPSDNTEGVFAFNDVYSPLGISASAAIDVYLMALTTSGIVRVDA
jgi:hypothetical protein